MERDRRAPRLRSRERPPVCSILPAAARITGIRRGTVDGFGGEFGGPPGWGGTGSSQQKQI